MPDFDFSNEARATNERFAAEIAQLTRLTSSEVNQFFPERVDKERLVELMRIVRQAATRNERAAQLRSNIQTLGETVIRLIDVVA